MNPILKHTNSISSEIEAKEKENIQNILEISYLENLSNASPQERERTAANVILARLHLDTSNNSDSITKSREFFNKAFIELTQQIGLSTLNPNKINRKTIQILKQSSNSEARLILGLIYNLGVNVTQSHTIAYNYYENAIRSTIGCIFSIRFPPVDQLGNEKNAVFKNLASTEFSKIAKFYWFKFAKPPRFNILNNIKMIKLYSADHFAKLEAEINQQFQSTLAPSSLPSHSDIKSAQENKSHSCEDHYTMTKEDEEKFQRAKSFVNQGKNAQAVAYFQDLSKKGHNPSKLNLATFLIEGRGIQKDVESGVKMLEEVAANEETLSLKNSTEHNLGITYLNHFEPPNYEKAFYWFKKAADNGCVYSMYQLGEFYSRGWWIEQDHRVAFEYFMYSAKNIKSNDHKGSPSFAMLGLGEYYTYGIEGYLDVNIKQAIHWLSLAHNEGHPDAAMKLAKIYSGRIYPSCKDYKKLQQYLLIAAKNGDVPAAKLFIFYALTSSNTNDHKISFKLAQKLMNQGIPVYYLLAAHYDKGFGVRQDLNEAIRLYECAATESSVDNLTLSKLINAHAQQQNFARAMHWASIAIEKFDDPYALFYKYFDYRDGYSGSIDPVRAVSLLESSAAKKYVPAMTHLGILKYYGSKKLSIPPNKTLGLELLKKAAESNSLKAITSLARIYFEESLLLALEESLLQEYSELGFKWTSLGAEQGEPECKYMLGLIYINGLGVEQNIQLGLEWVREASHDGFDEAKEYLLKRKNIKKSQSAATDVQNNSDYPKNKLNAEEKEKEVIEKEVEEKNEIENKKEKESEVESEVKAHEESEKTSEIESHNHVVIKSKKEKHDPALELPSFEEEKSLEYNATKPFNKWLDSLYDKERKAVEERIKRALEGNLGDVNVVRKGVLELKWTNGLRVYFMYHNKNIIFLLGGGKQKHHQDNDIETADRLRSEFLANLQQRSTASH